MSAQIVGQNGSSILAVDAVSLAARVTLYGPDGRALAFASKSAFFASGTFTPPATPTDMVTIFGSASKTVRVLAMRIATTNTAAGSQQFFLVRRSSVNTTGTFVAATAIQADTTDPAATATSFGHYTANPGGLGTTVGTLNTKRVASTVAVPASFAGIMNDNFVDMLDYGFGLQKPVTLRGAVQGLAINFAGAALVAGQTHAYNLLWTEEDS